MEMTRVLKGIGFLFLLCVLITPAGIVHAQEASTVPARDSIIVLPREEAEMDVYWRRIEAANATFRRSWGKASLHNMLKSFTSDAIIMPPGGMPISRLNDLESFQEWLLDPPYNISTKTLEVEAFENETATEVGGFRLMWERRGDNIEEGQYIVIWKRDQGRWKIHRMIYNFSQTIPID